MNFKEYKNNILENKVNEEIKTVEAAVDTALENSKDKKSAINFINKSKDSFIKKNKKKIIDMINKLPKSLF